MEIARIFGARRIRQQRPPRARQSQQPAAPVRGIDRHFRPRIMGTVFGAATMVSSVGMALGPLVNGTLRGDLLVVGSGDPTINPRHPERMTVVEVNHWYDCGRLETLLEAN